MAAFAVGAVVFLAAAPPASAHATLTGTEPRASETLATSPPRVLLRFDEPVEASTGTIRLHDSEGNRVDTGPPQQADGKKDSVAVELGNLPGGAYVVTWRVVSGDAHPVQGAFTFRVGEGAAGSDDSGDLAARMLASEGGSAATGVAYAIVRVLSLTSILGFVGGVAFLALFWQDGWASRRAWGLIVGAWGVVVVTTLVGLGVEGAYAAGRPLGDAIRPSVLADALESRLGRAWVARLVLLEVAAPLLLLWRRRGRPGPVLGLGGLAIGLGILATPGWAGHGATGRWVALAMPADVLHLAAVSLWVGGLVLLAVDILPRTEPSRRREVLARFSQAAMASVTVIVVTGVFQSWRQLGSLPALQQTSYGRLLIIKVALFAGMLALGWQSRRLLKRFRLGGLRRSVCAELGVGAGVLMATALLVNAQPGSSAVATKPYSTMMMVGSLHMEVTIDPAKVGPTDLHIYTRSHDGQVQAVEEVKADLRLPEREIGPLSVPMQRAGPGHFAVYGFKLPLEGVWQLDVAARLNAFDEVTSSTTFTAR